MKKMILFFVVLFIYIISISAKKRQSDGVYKSYSTYFEIKKDSFFLRTENPEYGLAIWTLDTLTSGSVKMTGEDFIELNTFKNQYSKASESMKVIQEVDKNIIGDSILIIFLIPNEEKLKIKIFNSRVYSFEYYKNNNSIKIPSTSYLEDISINPNSGMPRTVAPEGINLSKCYYYIDKEIPIEAGKNKITIELPGIDKEFFNRYYLKGEYAKIKGNKLIWRGDEYIKTK